MRLIPEWAAVRNKRQQQRAITPYRRRRLLEAAASASELTDRVERPDLLLIGVPLHDIGKGYPGDHTEVGMEIVRDDRHAHRVRPADVAVLVADLVRTAPLLPDTATWRDLDDPTTIAAMSPAMGDRVTLHLLGSPDRGRQPCHRGPSAWGPGSAGLGRPGAPAGPTGDAGRERGADRSRT